MIRKTLAFALAFLALAPAAVPARASTALRQLGREAGVDASPLARRMDSVRALAAAETPMMIPRFGKDVLAGCSALEVRTLMALNAKQAALLVQTCLNHAYAADGLYSVQARAVTPGITITVTGSVPAGDSVLVDLNGTVGAHGGKLLGFPAVVDDKTEALK